MYQFYCEFSVAGEIIGIYVDAKNRTDAKNLAWIDIYEAIDVDMPEPVLRSISLIHP